MQENSTTQHSNKTVVLHLEAGEEIWLNDSCAPRGICILGQDYSFTPPYRGRPTPGSGGDLHKMAVLAAMSPLALSVTGFWKRGDLQGALRIHHLRLQRPGIPALAGERICWDMTTILGAKEQNRLEDICEGGLRYAVLYPDETLLAGYRNRGHDSLPFCSVALTTELNVIRDNARRMLAGRRSLETKGVSSARHNRPCGLVVTKQVGPAGELKISFDQAGRIFKLEVFDPAKGEHTPREMCLVGRTIRLAVGEVITNPQVREGLDLPPMATTAPTIAAFRPIPGTSVGDRIKAAQAAKAAEAKVVDETPEPEPTPTPVAEIEETPKVELAEETPEVEIEETPEVEIEETPEVEIEEVAAPDRAAEVHTVAVDMAPTAPPASYVPSQEQIDALWNLLQGEKAPEDIVTAKGKILIREGREFRKTHAQVLLQKADSLRITEKNQLHTGLVFEVLAS